MPPSIVLEVLKITEAEMDLREETREVEQVRWALTDDEHSGRSNPLSRVQGELEARVEKVVKDIRALKNGAKDFAKEIALLEKVDSIMDEAEGILGRPETGAVAIATETEAIELLLQAKKSGGGGGGGGSSPGGSVSGGGTNLSALALMGRGLAENARSEEREVAGAVGNTGPEYPEEFRRGLERLMNALEREK